MHFITEWILFSFMFKYRCQWRPIWLPPPVTEDTYMEGGLLFKEHSNYALLVEHKSFWSYKTKYQTEFSEYKHTHEQEHNRKRGEMKQTRKIIILKTEWVNMEWHIIIIMRMLYVCVCVCLRIRSRQVMWCIWCLVIGCRHFQSNNVSLQKHIHFSSLTLYRIWLWKCFECQYL